MPATPPLTYSDAQSLIGQYLPDNDTNMISCADLRALILALMNMMAVDAPPVTGFTPYTIATVRAAINAVFVNNTSQNTTPDQIRTLTQVMLDYWASQETSLPTDVYMTTTCAQAQGYVNEYMVDNTANQISESKMYAIYHRWLDFIASIYNTTIVSEHHTDITFQSSSFPFTTMVADVDNYVAWINITDARWKNAPSGHVNYSDGRDIRFTVLGNTTNLAWELIQYKASTGQIRGWVKIPKLFHAANTPITIHYGSTNDYSAMHDKSLNNPWYNYAGVWHVDTFSGTDSDDSTPTNNSLFLPSGFTYPSIGVPSGMPSRFLNKAWLFSNASNNLLYATGMPAYINTQGTWCCWFQSTDIAPSPIRKVLMGMCGTLSGAPDQGLILYTTAGAVCVDIVKVGGSVSTLTYLPVGSGINDGNAHFINFQYDTSAGNYFLYVDGQLKATITGMGAITLVVDAVFVGGGNPFLTSYYKADAYVWDVRIYDPIMPSSDFVAQMINQENPGDVGVTGCYIVGSEY